MTEGQEYGLRIAKIAVALGKAQEAFPDIPKSKKVTVKSAKGSFSYSFTPLSVLAKAVKPALQASELSYTQITRFFDAQLWLVTVLMHSSGEYLESSYPVSADKANRDPQAFGSALTYAKRYSLAGILGIATEEDDDGKVGGSAPVIGKEQLSALKTAMTDAGKTADDVKALTKTISGQSNPRRLTPEQFKEVFARLGKRDLGDVR